MTESMTMAMNPLTGVTEEDLETEWTLWRGNQGTIAPFTYKHDSWGCHQRHGQDDEIKEYSNGLYYKYDKDQQEYDFSEAFAPQRDDGLFGPYPGVRYLYDENGEKKGYMDLDQNVYTYEKATGKYKDDDGVEYIVPYDGYAYYLYNGAYYARGDDTKSYYLHQGRMYENDEYDYDN